MESILQTFDGGSVSSTTSSNRSLLISRNGDLIYRIWIQADITYGATTPTGSTYINWTNNTGHALIEECNIEIGGQRIDKHTGQWLDILNELTDHEESEWIGLNKHSAKNAYLKSGNLTTASTIRLYIPLKFWFCRNPGLAIPLIALQYHEIKLNIKFRGIHALVNSDDTTVNPSMGNDGVITSKVWIDYIYLDTEERRRFAQVSHEYLIEQLQYLNRTSTTDLKLNFNHPIKELIWVLPQTKSQQSLGSSDTGLDIIYDATLATGSSKNDYFNYSSKSNSNTTEYIYGQESYEAFNTATIKLNGHSRFKEREASYFRLCQPQQSGHKLPTKHIYMYSFALHPEEHQPSGTCNFSRIDNAHLILNTLNDSTDTCKLNVYAINYNVLRIMSGMAGLAYSN